MSTPVENVDILIIGAGYYGCRIALHLADAGRVVLVDKARRIMTRASYVNQARVHGGYHYPRALDTAVASRRYFAKFLEDHRDAITWRAQSVYAIANGSKVSSRQFERVCAEVGAPLSNAPRHIEKLFDPALIDAVYLAQEFAFDSAKIAADMDARLHSTNVETMFGAAARVVSGDGERTIVEAGERRYAARAVFNCTYAALDMVGVPLQSGLRKEMAELALIRPPIELEDLSVTVMDGPFFSTLPFPSLGVHSLTHVRFTPVAAWADGAPAPQGMTLGFGESINGLAMLRDASRYLPILGQARLEGALFDIKTVMQAREGDDGRPILFEKADRFPGVVSILGAKVDNIYEVLEVVDDHVGNT